MLFWNLADENSGLDASISFESDREENIGVFVNASIGDVCLASGSDARNNINRTSLMGTPVSTDLFQT